MSENETENSNPEEILTDDVDALLSEVEQIADEVEGLIDTDDNPQKQEEQVEATNPEASEPADVENNVEQEISQTQAEQTKDALPEDIDSLLAEVENIADDVEHSINADDDTPVENTVDDTPAEPSEPQAPASTEATDDNSEQTQTTEQTEDLEKQAATTADDEINRILSLGHSAKQEAQAKEQAEQVNLSDIQMPRFVKFILTALISIDRLFYWIPRSTKNILGVIGVSTLIFASALWIMILFFRPNE